MASEHVKVLNDLNFEQEVLKSDVPVLVDFSAEWCGPCKALAPIVEAVADEMQGELKVGTLDVEQSPVTASKYGVASLPTLMVFKQGTVTAKHVGRTNKAKLKDLVAQ